MIGVDSHPTPSPAEPAGPGARAPDPAGTTSECRAIGEGGRPAANRSATYAGAGVDIEAGERAVELIKPLVAATLRPEVIGGLGGFGGLFALDADRYRQPVLVAGTDGVGTKALVAQDLGRFDTIGIDLVAMCVDDLVCQGAEPLFFLDYISCGAVEPTRWPSWWRGWPRGAARSVPPCSAGRWPSTPGS